MSPPSEETVFCHCKGKRFDADEFEEDSRFGLVHTRTPRHTTDGTLINPEASAHGGEMIPGPMDAPAEEWREDDIPPPPAAPAH